MTRTENNYAFIDSQNLYLALKTQGHSLDYRKFRQYLRDKHKVTKAIMYFGYMEERKDMYRFLERCGFDIVFKKIVQQGGTVKGNVDVLLTIQTLVRSHEYDRAILVTNDGDFSDLVLQLKEDKKFLRVIAPTEQFCSHLLKASAKGAIQYIDTHHRKLLGK